MPSAIQETAAEIEAELAQVAASAELIYRNAREENREPIDSEKASLKRLSEKRESLHESLDLATRSYAIDENVKAKLDLIRTGSGNPVAYRDAGALLWDMLHVNSDKDAATRYRRGVVEPVLSRAAQHMGLDKANTVATAGGFNGLVIAPNVGPVLDPYPGDMPLFSALGPNSITSATFMRPRIVDANFTTSMSDNPQEKAESQSKAWDILTEPVSMKIVRGYINVSELLVEMIADTLGMVITHMNKRLAGMLEGKAVAAVGDTTKSVSLAADATAAEVQAAVMQASGFVAAATGAPASWIAMGIDGWVRLGSLTNLAGDSILQVGAGDATNQGASVFGLRPILSADYLTGTDLYVGNSMSIEAYERRFPLMQALEPALWGRQIAVAAGYAFYDPITTEAGPADTPPAKREGVVKIDWA